MSETPQPDSKPKRHWYQFHLRHLFILTLVVAIVCACLASFWTWYLRPKVEFCRTFALIREFGGEVRDFDIDPGLGVATITSVSFFEKPLNDTDLERLEETFKGLPRLTRLNLFGTKITDAGLKHLGCLPQLRDLVLEKNQITNAGLEHLSKLKGLTALNLDRTEVGNAGLEHLKGLTNLERLFLNGTQVSDAGLEHLQGMNKLELLLLNGTKVTDAGLLHLKELTELKYLDLEDTQVSNVGVKKLQQALPNCNVWR